ncbi:MAG TPA: VOC family protein [Sphingobium sp.]
MDRVEITHVSVVACDIQTSIDWYQDIFGAETIVRMPSPKHVGPTCWMRIGHLSIHLAGWKEPVDARPNHFGIGVLDLDLFHSIYIKARDRDLFDRTTFGSHIYEMPSGEIQMYLLDPYGNVVEVNFPDASKVDRSIIDTMPKIAELYQPQPEDAGQSTLFYWLRDLQAEGKAV